MAPESHAPKPLDYAARPPRAGGNRAVIVALLGGGVALAGVSCFAASHALTDYMRLVAEHARMHELLWAEFGIALLFAGAYIAAVGLREWCRRDRG